MARDPRLGAILAMGMVGAAMEMAALSDPWDELDAPRKREPRPDPERTHLPRAEAITEPTDADRDRVRRAEQRRARQAARQAKGMRS